MMLVKYVLECWIFKLKICPKSKKHQKNFIIKINTLYIEKLGINICVSMYVTINSNKEMLIHYCE